MYAGQVVERGATDQVIGDPQHPYTQGLLACRPGLSERKAIVPIMSSILSSAMVKHDSSGSGSRLSSFAIYLHWFHPPTSRGTTAWWAWWGACSICTSGWPQRARRTSRPCSGATPKAEATDKQIDALVYELYGLSDEEIAVVEGRFIDEVLAGSMLLVDWTAAADQVLVF